MTNESGRPAEPMSPVFESLQAEARYRSERLGLYKARMYAGRARDPSKLRELERSSDGAAKRLRVAQERARMGSSRAPAPELGAPGAR